MIKLAAFQASGSAPGDFMKSNNIFVRFHTRFQSTDDRGQMSRLGSLSNNATNDRRRPRLSSPIKIPIHEHEDEYEKNQKY
jgi:hypothetical protein